MKRFGTICFLAAALCTSLCGCGKTVNSALPEHPVEFRNKTDSEIASLKPLTIDDAKLILDSLGVPEADRIVIPVVQKNSSYAYETDDAYREKAQKLFAE